MDRNPRNTGNPNRVMIEVVGAETPVPYNRRIMVVAVDWSRLIPFKYGTIRSWVAAISEKVTMSTTMGREGTIKCFMVAFSMDIPLARASRHFDSTPLKKRVKINSIGTLIKIGGAKAINESMRSAFRKFIKDANATGREVTNNHGLKSKSSH